MCSWERHTTTLWYFKAVYTTDKMSQSVSITLNNDHAGQEIQEHVIPIPNREMVISFSRKFPADDQPLLTV